MERNIHLLLLLVCLTVSATVAGQTPTESPPRSTNESTLFGYGTYLLQDSYLSPGTEMKYTGWMVRILNERMKMTRMAHEKIASQQFINIEFGVTHNGSYTANEYAMLADYSKGFHYRFDRLPLPGLRILTGASIRTTAGFIYNSRNSNNPVSGKGDIDLNLSAMVFYPLKVGSLPLTFRLQSEIPFAGALFSVHKGQPYYYLTQGDTERIIRFSSFHNKFAIRNLLTIDIPIAGFTVRTGYMHSFYRTDVNDIHTKICSHSLVVGFAKEFFSIRGKSLKNKHTYKSAYY